MDDYIFISQTGHNLLKIPCKQLTPWAQLELKLPSGFKAQLQVFALKSDIADQF